MITLILKERSYVKDILSCLITVEDQILVIESTDYFTKPVPIPVTAKPVLKLATVEGFQSNDPESFYYSKHKKGKLRNHYKPKL